LESTVNITRLRRLTEARSPENQSGSPKKQRRVPAHAPRNPKDITRVCDQGTPRTAPRHPQFLRQLLHQVGLISPKLETLVEIEAKDYYQN
jgi:hypothetical protein